MRTPAANNINHLVSSLSTEVECPACDGTEFPKVRQPDQPGRKINPAPCQQCFGPWTSGIFQGGWHGVSSIPAKSGRGFLPVLVRGYELGQAKAFENAGIPRNLRAFINIKFNENVHGGPCGCNDRIRLLLSTTTLW